MWFYIVEIYECLKHIICEFITYEYLKLIITNVIGGLITYLYVSHKENKKEARAIQREYDKDEKGKKEKCTRALLSTQMAISFQMELSKGAEDNIVNRILNFNLLGNTLKERFRNVPEPSIYLETIDLLKSIPSDQFKSLIEEITKYLITAQIENNLVFIPYEIFILPTISLQKKITVPEIADYFQNLKFCNKQYTDIILQMMHCNQMRNTIFEKQLSNEALEGYAAIIAGTIRTSFTLEKKIAVYLEMANHIFFKTENYIKLLNVFDLEPIPIEKDGEGRIILDRKE